MILQGAKALIEKFRELVRKNPDCKVSVGYTAAYAIFVHENLQAHHPVGQAKFLEQPLREMSNDGTLVGIVVGTVKGGGTFSQGILRAGLKLQAESMKLCPVLTGALRASAFTRLDEGKS